jgi:hypothetical protein
MTKTNEALLWEMQCVKLKRTKEIKSSAPLKIIVHNNNNNNNKKKKQQLCAGPVGP